MSAEYGSQRDILERQWALAEANNYVRTSLNAIAKHIHRLNAKWWIDPTTGGPRKFGYETAATKIALMHSELSETLEGLRKGLKDDHLPHRNAEEVELADVLIRIFDYAAWREFDIAGAVAEKLAYNENREDHKPEARAKAGGKKF